MPIGKLPQPTSPILFFSQVIVIIETRVTTCSKTKLIDKFNKRHFNKPYPKSLSGHTLSQNANHIGVDAQESGRS